MDHEFHRQQRRNENDRDPKGKSKLMIISGVVFLAFALWILFSTKNYTSLEFPIASKEITITMGTDEVKLSEEDAVKLSRRMQNSVRTREHEKTDETLTVTLGTGVVLTIDPEKKAGTIKYQGVEKPIRVDRKFVKMVIDYLEASKKKD